MTPKPKSSQSHVIRIALAGQPNVGKSVIFNQLTGLSQVIGNWPGKTVAKAEGTARFGGYTFKIIDLPGIYSLSTYSLEEVVSRDYILNEKPDYIINVVDSSHLERNLFLTLQLAMLNRPMILALNQFDLLHERGYEIDIDKFSKQIGIPIIPTIAVHNRGVYKLLETIIQIEEHKEVSSFSANDFENISSLKPKPILTPNEDFNSHKHSFHKKSRHLRKDRIVRIRNKRKIRLHGSFKRNFADPSSLGGRCRLNRENNYSEKFPLSLNSTIPSKPLSFSAPIPISLPFGKEIEDSLNKIQHRTPKQLIYGNYPIKFLALKLLENDEESIRMLRELNPQEKENINRLLYFVGEIRQNLEEMHGEQISIVINAEIYNISLQIVNNVLELHQLSRKKRWSHYLDHITLDNITGYIFFFVVMIGIYFAIFKFGDLISGLLDVVYKRYTPSVSTSLGGVDSWLYKILWIGVVGGLFAGVGGVLPYVIPFFMVIEILQDTGYLPRAAYLMDRFMHHLGVHGKTIIPVLIGFGCNVPAVSAAMIMETEKEKKRAIIISSMIPCSAVTTIVMGLVANELGFWYAILLYFINFAVIVGAGKILTLMDKDDSPKSELIIELHDFRKPNLTVILKQTWARSKEFIYMALPLIVVLGIFLQIMLEFQLMDPINNLFSPITVYALGLPEDVGVYLFYGVLRKELNLVLLNAFVTSQGMEILGYMTALQIFTFTLVTMLYVPCLATIVVIKKEAGRKFALQVFFFEIILALVFGSAVHWGGKLFSLIF
ncbi:MAG: ferrous iron transporter B [Promethearchaeota archaeon]